MGTIHGIQTNFDAGDILFCPTNVKYLVVVYVVFDGNVDIKNSYEILEFDYVCVCESFLEALHINIFDKSIMQDKFDANLFLTLQDYYRRFNLTTALKRHSQKNDYAILHDL